MLSSALTQLQKVMQTKTYQLGQILPVCPGSQLLGGARHQILLQEIEKLSGLAEAHFKALYWPVINEYAEFVQLIPAESQNVLGGLLNLGLARATLGLRQFTSEAGTKWDHDPLVNYAIFTAGLFFDVSKVVSQQKIVICDQAGNYLREWYPYSGSLVSQKAESYKMYAYKSTVYEALNRDSAALLARQLMAAQEEGFTWLSSDLELFIDWLDTLRGEYGQGGRRIARLFSLLPWDDLMNLTKVLGQMPIDVTTLKTLPLDDQFYLWLREGLNSGAISINTTDAYVHLLEDGTLYLNNEIFKRFIEASKVSGDANQLASDFNERFGLSSQAVQEKPGYAGFLMQRGDQKMLVIRNGIFLPTSLITMDTTSIPVSPLQAAIKGGLQQARQLPGIKQTLSSEFHQRPGANFKMR